MSANLNGYEAILDTNIWYYCADTSPSREASEKQRQADIRTAIEDFKNNNNRLLISEYSLWECVSRFYSENDLANFLKSLKYIVSNQIDVINIDSSISSIVVHNKYGHFLGIDDFGQVESQIDSIIRYKARYEASALVVLGYAISSIICSLLAGEMVACPYRLQIGKSVNSSRSGNCSFLGNIFLDKAIDDQLYSCYKDKDCKPDKIFQKILYRGFYESANAVISRYYQDKGDEQKDRCSTKN